MGRTATPKTRRAALKKPASKKTRLAFKAKAEARAAKVKKPTIAATSAPEKPKRPAMKIGAEALARSKIRPMTKAETFRFPDFPPGVAPDAKADGMAQDEALSGNFSWAQGLGGGLFSEGIGFLGFTYLAELAQRPEYRRISERIATEMTRRWIKLKATGEVDLGDKLKKIEDEMKRLNVQAAFQEVAVQDGFFGRSHLYIDTGDTDNREELKTPIGDGRNDISKAKFKKGSLARLKPIEAMWTYPLNYNSNDPMKPDWYKPSTWVVMGKEVHASRLLTFVGREVPDLLKPAYSFGGLSLSQMAKPYVDNWLETRESVADIISAFSVFVLASNMAEALQTSGDEVFKRADFFNNMRNNRGLMMIDKEMEDFTNVSAPLGTLDMLQAQSQEQMASVSGIPLIVLLGIQPAGLNATSEGELRAFYEWIHAYQVLLFTPNLTRVIDFIQLSLFGAVDPNITFEYEPLESLSEKEIAETRDREADTDGKYVSMGAIEPEEVRKRLASDPDSAYAGITIEDNEPPAPAQSEEEEVVTS